MDLNRQVDIPMMVADELEKHLDEVVSMRRVVEVFVEYILESDMQGLILPTEIISLLDCLGYFVMTANPDGM